MKKTLAIIFTLLAGVTLSAQNLDPVVEVTNAYSREATGIEKPSQLLPLPDSVSRFNLDFDYSVKPTPYKGAYEFNPYLIEMRPGAMPSPENRLYLSAGAGYSLHPQLDFVWNPVRKDGMRFNLYAHHRSYFGDYRNITFGADALEHDGTSLGKGMNANTLAGAGFLYGYKGGTFTADFSYRNTSATDFFMSEHSAAMHNRVQAKLRVKGGRKFQYEAGTRIGYGAYSAQGELFTKTDLSLGFGIGKSLLSVGAGLESVSYDLGSAAIWEVMPHYLYSGGHLKARLGVKISGVLHSSDTDYAYGGGFIFPDVSLSFRIAEGAVLQAAATGGNSLNTYDSLLGLNPYLAGFAWTRDVTVERFNVWGGVKGSASGRFYYDIKAGYKWFDNAFAWSYYSTPLLPAMVYASPLRTLYADAQMGWRSSSWDVSAHVYYGNTAIPELETELEKNVLAPAAFSADGHVLYNWNDRVRVGALVEARSSLNGRLPVPAYQDLGLLAEYGFSRYMTFWLRGGNLLNQSIQRIPFHAEGGIYVTGGVRIVL